MTFLKSTEGSMGRRHVVEGHKGFAEEDQGVLLFVGFSAFLGQEKGLTRMPNGKSGTICLEQGEGQVDQGRERDALGSGSADSAKTPVEQSYPLSETASYHSAVAEIVENLSAPHLALALRLLQGGAKLDLGRGDTGVAQKHVTEEVVDLHLHRQIVVTHPTCTIAGLLGVEQCLLEVLAPLEQAAESVYGTKTVLGTVETAEDVAQVRQTRLAHFGTIAVTKLDRHGRDVDRGAVDLILIAESDRGLASPLQYKESILEPAQLDQASTFGSQLLEDWVCDWVCRHADRTLAAQGFQLPFNPFNDGLQRDTNSGSSSTTGSALV
jgi:hypothetical protein